MLPDVHALHVRGEISKNRKRICSEISFTESLSSQVITDPTIYCCPASRASTATPVLQMARPYKHSPLLEGPVQASLEHCWGSKGSIWAGHQLAMSGAKFYFGKKAAHPPARVPPPGQPQQSLSTCIQNTPTNYLCSWGGGYCLTGNLGTLQKGCKQWDSWLITPHSQLAMLSHLLGGGEQGSSPVFLEKRRRELNKQTNKQTTHWPQSRAVSWGSVPKASE